MATFTVTIALDDVDDHESEDMPETAVDSLGILRIEIDTTLINLPLSALINRAVCDWSAGVRTGEITDNGKRIGTYWTESE